MQNASSSYEFLSSRIKNNQGSKVNIKEQAQKILSELHSSDQKLFSEFNYHDEAFHYTSNLTNAIERLEMTPIFLGRFPRTKTFDKNGITIHRWIQYHYSNYLVTVISIYDTALLLTNTVFCLGVEPRRCSDKTVTNNQSVRKTSVKSALDKLNEIMKPYRDPRNFFVHRNIIPGLASLDEWESLRFIEEASKGYKIDTNPIMETWLVKELYQFERRALIQEVRKESDRIAEGIYQFFTDLYPVYLAFSEYLKKRD